MKQGRHITRRAIKDIDRAIVRYDQGQVDADWPIVEMAVVDFTIGDEVQEVPTESYNVGKIFGKRTVALRSLKRDLALATMLLASLVATSLCFKTKWGKGIQTELQKIKALRRGAKLVEQMTANKYLAVLAIAATVEGIALTGLAASAETRQAKHCAAGYATYIKQAADIDKVVEASRLEEELQRLGNPKAAHHLHEMELLMRKQRRKVIAKV